MASRTLHDEQPARYGCLERRADAEAVMSGRIHPDVHERYRSHVRECHDCRRAHQTLEALYRGPSPPPGPSQHAKQREFAAILRRIPDERPAPRYQQLLLTTGVAALTAVAAALALKVAGAELGAPYDDDDDARAGVAQASARSARDARDPSERARRTVARIEHPAQVDYGRIIGGRATLLDIDDQVITANTFEVGTRFRVPADHTLQARFLGKLLTNLDGDSELRWTSAEPDLIELELQRGMIATRYDRLPEDPVLRIRTPSAVVRVVGTVFTVEVEGDGDTAVSVLRGEVEVLDPVRERVVAEIAAGYRFDVASSTYTDIGPSEIAAALPLSEATRQGDGDDAAVFNISRLDEDLIPESWVVPGLPNEPELRTLRHLIRRSARPPTRTRATLSDEELFNTLIAPLAPGVDDGDYLLELMRRDFEHTRRKELRAKLNRCQGLYQSTHTRYLAARCITEFMNRHGHDHDVAEGWLLYGILRMDYANDYQAAMSAFNKFLTAAPHHSEAELALYRLWLASTELGKIGDAEQRGREYLRRYPNGKYVGKILQRFPKLIVEL